MDQKLTSSQSGTFSIFAAIIGLGLLVALAFSLNALFASRLSQPTRQLRLSLPPQSTTTPIEQSTALPPSINFSPSLPPDLKKYMSSDLGLLLGYPENWSVRATPLRGQVSFTSPNLVTDYVGIVERGAYVSLEVLENPNGWTAKEWTKKSEYFSESQLKSEIRDITVGGRKGVRFSVDIRLWGKGEAVVIPGKGDTIYIFTLFHGPEGDAGRFQQIFDMMMSHTRLSG